VRERDQRPAREHAASPHDAVEVLVTAEPEPGLHHRSASWPYGVSCWRPLRRRFRINRRPAGESMRLRKPWTRRRYRFLGWYVRLMAQPLWIKKFNK
jgi:hypothetical protein